MNSMGGQGGGSEADKQKAQEERMRQQEDMKHSILSQVLDQNARARRKCCTHPFSLTKIKQQLSNRAQQ